MKKFKALVRKRKLKKRKIPESDMLPKELGDIKFFADEKPIGEDNLYDFLDPTALKFYKRGASVELDSGVSKASLISISKPFENLKITQNIDRGQLSIFNPQLKRFSISKYKKEDKVIIDAEIKIILPTTASMIEPVKKSEIIKDPLLFSFDKPKISPKEEIKTIQNLPINSVPAKENSFNSANKLEEVKIQKDEEPAKKPSNETEENKDNSANDFDTMFVVGNSNLLPCSAEVRAKTPSFDMMLEMEAGSDWKLKLNKPFAKIYLKKGTSRYPSVPVVKAFLDMELNVLPENLNFILYDIEIRKKWDKASVSEFIEITKTEDVVHYYMLNKAPWPFTDRDFVEKRYMRKRDNGDIEIYFEDCAHAEYPERGKKVTRGKTILGGQIMRRKISKTSGQPTLLVTFICQADMNGKIPAKALKETLPASMLKWYKAVQKELKSFVCK